MEIEIRIDLQSTICLNILDTMAGIEFFISLERLSENSQKLINSFLVRREAMKNYLFSRYGF